MPDWVYELVEAFISFMDGLTLVDELTFAASATVVAFLVVLIHEIGHLIAAVTLRHRVAELVVGDGDDPLLTVRAGGFQIRLGTITGSGDTAGYVVYDGTQATPRDALIIALAGPFASLAGAVTTGVTIPVVWSHAGIAFALVAATALGLLCFVGNMVPSGENPGSWSDGRWAQVAWRALRAPSRPEPLAWTDPHEATSVAPPTP
jgi:membrane-associated protease RseP (regulator of RpoE activity)